MLFSHGLVLYWSIYGVVDSVVSTNICSKYHQKIILSGSIICGQNSI